MMKNFRIQTEIMLCMAIILVQESAIFNLIGY